MLEHFCLRQFLPLLKIAFGKVIYRICAEIKKSLRFEHVCIVSAVIALEAARDHLQAIGSDHRHIGGVAQSVFWIIEVESTQLHIEAAI